MLERPLGTNAEHSYAFAGARSRQEAGPLRNGSEFQTGRRQFAWESGTQFTPG